MNLKTGTLPLPRWKKAIYIFLGLLAVVMVGLSFAQIWVMNSVDQIPGYGVVRASEQGLPPPDERGAFLVLNDAHNPNYPSTLVELLATTEAGVVDAKSGAHLLPGEVKAVMVQSAVVSDGSEYRVYRIGDPSPEPMKFQRLTGGKQMLIEPKDGTWDPGPYIVDIPSEGMFGGRSYFQFYVDAPK